MKELFTEIKKHLVSKEPLVLVTVIESTGSVPRGAGALMLVEKEGRLWGSIGGGFCEHLAIEEAKAVLSQYRACAPSVSFKRYMLHPSGAADLGAACGGEISLFFRSLDAAEPGLLDIVETAITCFNGKQAAWLILEVCSETLSAAANSAAKNTAKSAVYEPAADFPLGIEKEDGSALFSGNEPQVGKMKNHHSFLKSAPALAPALYKEAGRLWFTKPLVQGGFVYVFGGGHVAQELVPLLTHVGFRCIVFDDREEFVKSDLFPDAEKIILGNFEKIGEYLTLGKRDYAVILTRGHLWDFEAWSFALESPAAYIGVIGSKAKHELVKNKLRERGFSPDAINAPRVYAPIGVEIKSETAAEIAISIVAELIHVRAKIYNNIDIFSIGH